MAAQRSERAGDGSAKRRFPNPIRRLRKDAGLTAASLAAILGVSRNYVWRVEAGVRVPSAIMLHDMAIAFGVSIPELYSKQWAQEREPRIKAALAEFQQW